MKEEKFTNILGEIDEKYVAEVFEETKAKRILPFKKIVAIAACICLLLASATIVIAEVFDIGFNKFNEKIDLTYKNIYGQEITLDYTAEAYVLDYDVKFHSLDSFGPMEELKKGIDRQGKRIMHVSELPPEHREQFIETYGAESAEVDVLGEHLSMKTFENREAALEYVGFDGFEFPDYGIDDETAEVYLYGYSSSELTSLYVNLSDKLINLYEEPNIVFSYSAHVSFGESTEAYVLDYDVKFHSLDSFGPMEELKKGIDRQGKRIMHVSELPPEHREQFIETYGAESAEVDVLGEHLSMKTFENREAALEYVGFDGFEFPDYGIDDETAEVYLYGYSSSELTSLYVNLSDKLINLYEEPNIVFSYSAHVSFGESNWDGHVPYAGFEGDTFSEERFTSENGIEYLVVRRIGEDGLTKEIRSFLIKDDILYEAYMIDYQYEENLENYTDFIHNWANFY